jgi:hypothetical protein
MQEDTRGGAGLYKRAINQMSASIAAVSSLSLCRKKYTSGSSREAQPARGGST